MSEQLILSRYKLTTFLTCQRQFQLRYLDQLHWPTVPLDDRGETAVHRGQAFHQLVQRHYLGLTIQPEMIDDGTVRRWWAIFNDHPPSLPDGELLPEMSLTVPVGDFLVNGRFDLLVKGTNAQGAPFAHLFDWKTGKPRTIADCRQDWQTRLYLAMLAEGYPALEFDAEFPLTPENISMTYWYVQEPDSPRTINYSLTEHQQTWQLLTHILSQLSTQLNEQTWPLTETVSHCRLCPFQVVCGRQEAGVDTLLDDEDSDWEWMPAPIAPDSP